MQATARIAFRKTKSRKTVDDKSPVKLCITHKGERRYYSITDRIKVNDWLFLSDAEVKSVSSKIPRGKYKDIANEYQRIEKLAKDIINDLPEFSFGLFEDKFFNKTGSWENVFSALWGHIQELKTEGRIGYASSFESTLRAMKEFHTGKELKFNSRDKVEDRHGKYLEGKKLSFPDITSTWLKKFDAAMRDQGKSRSTVGIYMRNIRVLFNKAVRLHGVKAVYPFYDYTPKSAGSRKLALSAYQISLIANYQTDDPQAQYYRDIFIFSFLANGMNLSDIARLKYSDIKRNEIVFVREKTKDESNEDSGIHVPVSKQMQRIIDQYGNKVVGHDTFIFSVLNHRQNDREQYAAIKQFTKVLNRNLKQIAVAVGITEKMSSYVARHSFSTILKNSGASVEFIKEALGHSSIQVTQKYLKSFPSDVRREQSEKLEEQVFKTGAI